MKIAELERIQKAYAKAENAWLAAAQDPATDATFVGGGVTSPFTARGITP